MNRAFNITIPVIMPTHMIRKGRRGEEGERKRRRRGEGEGEGWVWEEKGEGERGEKVMVMCTTYVKKNLTCRLS